MEGHEVLKVERHPNHVVLSLNRPEKRNALNRELLEALAHAIDAAEADRAVRVIVIRGEGRSFCSGADMREIDQIEAARSPITPQSIFRRIGEIAIPTIAAMHGDVLTGGLMLGLHCDIRIAGAGARLGVTAARIGRMPDWHIFHKFVETIGPANTAELMYSAESVTAARALEMGLVNRVVADDQIVDVAGAIAARIAGNAPLSVRAMKQFIRRAAAVSADADHKDLDQIRSGVWNSKDAKEGVRAFLEKRKAVWSGE